MFNLKQKPKCSRIPVKVSKSPKFRAKPNDTPIGTELQRLQYHTLQEMAIPQPPPLDLSASRIAKKPLNRKLPDTLAERKSLFPTYKLWRDMTKPNNIKPKIKVQGSETTTVYQAERIFTTEPAETQTSFGTGHKKSMESSAREKRGIRIGKIVKTENEKDKNDLVDFSWLENKKKSFNAYNLIITVCFHEMSSSTRKVVQEDAEILPKHALFHHDLTTPFKGKKPLKKVVLRYDDYLTPVIGSKWHKPLASSKLEVIKVGIQSELKEQPKHSLLSQQTRAVEKLYQTNAETKVKALMLLEKDEAEHIKYLVPHKQFRPPKPSKCLGTAEEELMNVPIACTIQHSNDNQRHTNGRPKDNQVTLALNAINEELASASDASTPPSSPKRLRKSNSYK